MPRWLLASAAAANPTAAATAASCMFRSMSCKPDKGSYANSTYPPTGSPACAKPWPTTTNCNGCWKKFPSTNGSGCKVAGRNSVLRRLIHYAEKLYGLRDRLLAEVGDIRPRIPTSVVVQSALVLFWARLGSLKTLASAPFWKKWLGCEVPSVDTIGRGRAGGGRVAAGDSPRLRTTQAQQGASADWGWPSSTACPTPATAVAVQDVSSEPCSAAPASRCSITIAK